MVKGLGRAVLRTRDSSSRRELSAQGVVRRRKRKRLCSGGYRGLAWAWSHASLLEETQSCPESVTEREREREREREERRERERERIRGKGNV